MPSNLLYIGSPLLDVCSACHPEYLTTYNLKENDCIRATKEHKQLFTDLLQNQDSSFSAGGSGQNSARISKWVLKNAGKVSFSGCVGKDKNAYKMKWVLERDCVEPLYCVHDSLPTGLCACLIGSCGQRTMCTDLGAAATFDLSHLGTPKVQVAMKDADAIYIAGYFLGHSAEVVQVTAEYCTSENKFFAFSLSATYVCEKYADLLMKCMPFIDIIFGNYQEAMTLIEKVTGQRNVSIKQCSKVIADFPKKDGAKRRIAIISDGAEPLAVCEASKEPTVYDVPKLDNLVDTVGCGDALAGGFLTMFVLSGSIDKAAKTGIHAATQIAQTTGCTVPSTDPP